MAEKNLTVAVCHQLNAEDAHAVSRVHVEHEDYGLARAEQATSWHWGRMARYALGLRPGDYDVA